MPRLVFEKKADSVWISHLDTMRVFQRAFRRAGVMLKHSQGFTPRAIVSIALPLSVGIESQCELLDFELEEGTVTAEQLNLVLPEGIRVLDVVDSVRKIKELMYLRAKLTLSYDRSVTDMLLNDLRNLYSQEHLILKKHSRKGETETDILPMLHEIEILKIADDQIEMNVLVNAQNPALNPQLLINAIELYASELMPDDVRIRRIEIFDAQKNVFR